MNLIDEACSKIINPVKFTYSTYDLGTLEVILGKSLYPSARRHDFFVFNKNNHKLNCSLYRNSKLCTDWCVLYLHSMNGTRLESISYAQQILSIGLSFCNFDFSGCGNSEGNIVSFGANQKFDVSAVLECLRKKHGFKKFIIWGRSMGAVCALKYCETQVKFRNDVQALILDSPFKSLKQLVIEIGSQKTGLPQFIISGTFESNLVGLHIIKRTLEQKGGFKIEQLQIQQIINKVNIPILFLASKQDNTIQFHHSQDLFENYHYEHKQLVVINGVHNETRDKQYIQNIKTFINKIVNEKINESKRISFGYKKINLEEFIITNSTVFLQDSSDYQNQNCMCTFINRKI